MKTMKRLRFTLIEMMVVCVIFITITVIVLGAGALIIGGCYLGSEVHKKGLKPSVERVWEGPSSDSEVQKQIVTDEVEKETE